MQQIAKRTLVFLLTLCLLMGFMSMGAQAALLDGADYITQQLSLGEDLVLHLQGYVPDNYKNGATATVSYAGNTDTYTISDMTPDENGLYDLPVELAVAQMTEEINLVLNAKYLGMNVEAINEVYSIQNYLMTILEGDYSQMTMELCLELLNLGSRAQEYFNYNTDNLADAGNTITPANAVPAESPAVKVDGSVDGIAFYGASVRFLSQTSVRFYFKADTVDGYTFTIDGTEYEAVAKDGLYYIDTPGINPQNMSKEIAVNVTDGNGTLSVGYAPMWYFIRSYNKADDDTTKNLMAAAYSYYKEAETYTTNICMDVEITTLGNSTEDIEIGFFPLNYEGDINNTTDKVTVKAGTTTTVKLEQGNYLVEGELPGIGFAVFGGPEWNTTLEDGTNDKHTIKISNMRLEGAGERSIDMSNATVATGNTDTGYTNANNFGTASVVDGTIVIANGCRYDAHKITLNEIETYISLDMLITTLGNSTEPISVGFYPHNFEGDINDMTDSVTVTAGTTATVKLDMSKYLVNGEIPGIGFAVFGGPTWDATLEDGTADRHTITISNMKLQGAVNRPFNLNYTVVASGNDGTGYTNANGSGQAAIADGMIVISDGFCYDGHKITFTDEKLPEDTEPEATEPEVTEPEVTDPPVEEPDTYICMDMLFTTLGNSSDPVEIGFYPYNFEGDIGNFTDKIAVTAGTTSTVKLDLSKYLVDGELTGIGFVALGGPEWNTQLEDGTYDRHSITISGIRLEGSQSAVYDLSASTWTGGTNAGYTNANGSGQATIGSSIVITNGFRFDGHKITLVKAPDTCISLDMLFTTLGNSSDPVEIGFYPYNFEGDVGGYTDKLAVTAGTTSTVKLDLSKYLVDGELPGIGFVVLGGPEWNTTLADGSADKHTLTVSNVKLVGKQSAVYDLSASTWTNGTNAGYTNANNWGQAAIGSSIVISDGIRFDGHKLTLVEEPDTYICLDMLFTTLGNSSDPVEIGFYPYNFEGDINNHIDRVAITAGTTTTVKLDLSKYLVDGELTGIGFAIFGGPTWDAKLADGTTPDRHTLTISGIRLEGKQSAVYDLSQSQWANGNNGTGYTNANSSGTAVIGESIVITNGFRYDGHKITLVEDPNTYICMDVLFTTLGNSTEPLYIRYFSHDFAGNFHGEEYIDNVVITAGTKKTVRLKVDEYLIDGELPGIGFGIFGGPEWNSTLEDGTADRHSVIISNIHMEGPAAEAIDLSAVVKGLSNSNTGGTATIVDGTIVITDGYRFDGYQFTF